MCECPSGQGRREGPLRRAWQAVSREVYWKSRCRNNHFERVGVSALRAIFVDRSNNIKVSNPCLYRAVSVSGAGFEGGVDSGILSTRLAVNVVPNHAR